MREFLTVIGIIVLVIGVMALSTWIFMLLWNVVAGYFGFKSISFWISACIVLLLSYVKTTVSNKKS